LYLGKSDLHFASLQQSYPVTVKVKESRKIGEQFKQLLAIAKIGVDRAIETNEANANDWLKQQLKALGVNLS